MALLRSSSVHREAALLVEIPSLIYIYIYTFASAVSFPRCTACLATLGSRTEFR